MFGFQYESGKTSASTYFTTGDSPTTRQADRLTYPSAGNFVGSEGTTLGEYTTFWEDNTPTGRHLINVSQSPETQSLAYWLAAYPNLLSIDTNSNFVEAPRSSGANTIIPFSISYGPSGLAMSNDGNLDTDPLYSGDIGTGPNIWIGCQYGGADAGASFMDGTVRNVQIYNEEGQ
jgi:hypothetical protein